MNRCFRSCNPGQSRSGLHGERSLRPINWPTSPLAGSVDGGARLIISSIFASNPVSHLDAHRGLWEVLAIDSKRIRIEECADKGSINGPLYVGRGPVDRVSVPSSDRVGHVLVDSSVVGRGVSLSKEVALHRRSSEPNHSQSISSRSSDSE